MASGSCWPPKTRECCHHPENSIRRLCSRASFEFLSPNQMKTKQNPEKNTPALSNVQEGNDPHVFSHLQREKPFTLTQEGHNEAFFQRKQLSFSSHHVKQAQASGGLFSHSCPASYTQITLSDLIYYLRSPTFKKMHFETFSQQEC